MGLLIITGMSGSGKSRIANALEDIGYFCTDNMPPELIKSFITLLDSDRKEKVAIVTDSRSGEKFRHLFDTLDFLKDSGVPYKLMFIDAADEVLINRYKETRRRHPLQSQTVQSLGEAVGLERKMMKTAREKADIIFDTTGLSAIQCRVRVTEMFSETKENAMGIHCISFGYKHGIPNDADLVFDVRCLPNPFYVPELKKLTGLDSAVFDYVMKFEQSKEYAQRLFQLVDFSLELYREEGRSQLILAFGCTGGHHRSVTFARLMYEHLKNNGFAVSVSHRDILK